MIALINLLIDPDLDYGFIECSKLAVNGSVNHDAIFKNGWWLSGFKPGSTLSDPGRSQPTSLVLRYHRLYIYPISTSILTLLSSYFYLDIYSHSTVVIQLSEFNSLYYSAICF